MGGVAGAGRGAAAVGAQGAQEEAERRLMADRAKLEEEKTARIEEARAARQRAAGVQMGQDISAEEERLRNIQDAEAINKQFGSSMTAEDAAALRGNEAARSAYGLLAPTRQSDLERRATAAENLGYLEAARESRGQLQTEIQGQRYEKEFESREKRLDQDAKFREQQAKMAESMAERRARMDEAELAFRKSQAAKASEREKDAGDRELRLATRDALAGVNNQLKSLEKEAADPMLAPEQKDVIRGQMRDLRMEGERYRRALAWAGLEGSTAPSKPFDPDDFRTGGSQPAQREASAPRAPAARQPAAAPVDLQTPSQQAVRGLDLAIQNTVRALTDASNRGDRAEVDRLNSLLQEQQAAKARAVP